MRTIGSLSKTSDNCSSLWRIFLIDFFKWKDRHNLSEEKNGQNHIGHIISFFWPEVKKVKLSITNMEKEEQKKPLDILRTIFSSFAPNPDCSVLFPEALRQNEIQIQWIYSLIYTYENI